MPDPVFDSGQREGGALIVAPEWSEPIHFIPFRIPFSPSFLPSSPYTVRLR